MVYLKQIGDREMLGMKEIVKIKSVNKTLTVKVRNQIAEIFGSNVEVCETYAGAKQLRIEGYRVGWFSKGEIVKIK